MDLILTIFIVGMLGYCGLEAIGAIVEMLFPFKFEEDKPDVIPLKKGDCDV